MPSSPRPWPTREACLQALSYGDGGGVTVAVLDTGIDPTHPDLTAMPFAGAWRVAMDAARQPIIQPCVHARDPSGHGTAIAGIIHRLAPAARILSITVLDAGLRQHRHEVIRRGADFALSQGATIMNCSFGVPGSNHTLALYQDWTDRAHRHGTAVVAASSNEAPDCPELPAFCSHVIGVGAGDLPHPGTLIWRRDHPVAFLAPGFGIRIALPGGESTLASGSSFAAAHVTGLLARLISAMPGLSPAFAREALEHFACELPEPRGKPLGHGQGPGTKDSGPAANSPG